MLRIVLLAIPIVGIFASPVIAIINPHYEEHCPSCHIQNPEKQADGSMDYNFLAEDIDPTCLICHEQECCTIRKPHESTHASGINDWDEEKYGIPQQLPLSDGYITCATCHYWRRSNNPSPKDYKLVRLVEISDTSIKWTVLCHDCHKDY
jgi:hypothetical protein